MSAAWDFTFHGLLWRFVAIFLLVLLNGFFVALEFAIVKIRPSQIQALLDQKEVGAKLARQVSHHLDAYLSATQLGITLASLGLGWVGEPFLQSVLTPLFTAMGLHAGGVADTLTFLLAFSAITFLHIVLGEQSPKTLAIRKSVQVTLWCAPILHLFYTLFRPAIAIINYSSHFLLKHLFRLEPANETELFHSEEELRLIIDESNKAKEVTALGKTLAINALDLRHRVVRDIMTPRSEVIYLDPEKPFESELAKAIASQHTRFPICSGELDDAVKLVHIKDLLGVLQRQGHQQATPDPITLRLHSSQDQITSEVVHKVERSLLHVSEMMSLEKLLNFFLSKHAHFAVAVDEYGGAVGIVTLDNVLEELVGAIQDEFDQEDKEFYQISELEFEVAGALALHDLAEMIQLKFEETEVSTIGGYVTQKLGHIPQKGEKIVLGDYAVTVLETDGRRVLTLHFIKNS